MKETRKLTASSAASRGAWYTRRAVIAAATAAALAGLVACGSPAGDSGAKTKLTMLSWDDPKVMQPVIDEFQKENPDVTVEMSFAPPVQQYISTLQTRVLSNTAPDVFFMAAENKTNLIGAKAIKDLTNKPYMSSVNEFNKETYSRDGKVYGMSVASWGAGIAYNKALTDRVGMTTPPATWDEFLALCEKLKKAGIKPITGTAQGFPAELAAMLGAANEQAGGNLDEKIFDGSASFKDTWTGPLEKYNQLLEKGLLDRNIVGLTGEQAHQEFARASAAMFAIGPWEVPAFRKEAPALDFGIMPIPGETPETSYFAGAAAPGYAINAKTKNEAAADKLLAFMASPKGAELYSKVTQAITTTEGYTPVVDKALDPVVKGVRDGDIYLPQIGWKRHEDVLYTTAMAELQQWIQGKQSSAEVGEALDQKLKELDAKR